MPTALRPCLRFPRGDARLYLTDLYVFPAAGDVRRTVVVPISPAGTSAAVRGGWNCSAQWRAATPTIENRPGTDPARAFQPPPHAGQRRLVHRHDRADLGLGVQELRHTALPRGHVVVTAQLGPGDPAAPGRVDEALPGPLPRTVAGRHQRRRAVEQGDLAVPQISQVIHAPAHQGRVVDVHPARACGRAVRPIVTKGIPQPRHPWIVQANLRSTRAAASMTAATNSNCIKVNRPAAGGTTSPRVRYGPP
jgi:hypothetical protein